MEFAIAINTTSDDRGRAVVDYKEAKKLFDFICRNVSLPDVVVDGMDKLSDSCLELMRILAEEVSKRDSKKEVAKG
jgi:hypothetical protein